MKKVIKKVLASLANRTSTKDLNQRQLNNRIQRNLIINGLEDREY